MKQAAYSSNVEITYKLSGVAAIITLAIETNSVAIPDSAVTRLEGDVSVVVEPGEDTKSITWNAGADWPGNITETAVARVTAWSFTNPPEVMVVDLRKGTEASAENQYPVNYYPSIDALLHGVKNAMYKKDYLVLKKIKNGGFLMGEENGIKPVTLTKDFFIGVYEVTRGQWENIAGTGSSYFTETNSMSFRPVESVSYEAIRGKVSEGFDWPDDKINVDPISFMGKLRACTGGSIRFDLPTEAQWEYACRASTTTYYSDGIPGTPISSNAQIDVIGRYAYNGGMQSSDGGANWKNAPKDSTSDFGTAIVGSYLPNAWGLYDMHGNVWELCLDRYAALTGGTDPVGSETAANRTRRSGAWTSNGLTCRSASRNSATITASNNYTGFRVGVSAIAPLE